MGAAELDLDSNSAEVGCHAAQSVAQRIGRLWPAYRTAHAVGHHAGEPRVQFGDGTARRRCASLNTARWSSDSRRIDPMSRSTWPFCHGERGAVGRSLISIARMRRVYTGSNAPSRLTESSSHRTASSATQSSHSEILRRVRRKPTYIGPNLLFGGTRDRRVRAAPWGFRHFISVSNFAGAARKTGTSSHGSNGSIRRECLDHLVVSDEGHLRRVLKTYAAYYNQVRTHLALSKDAPTFRRSYRIGSIVALPILGGLHHQYVRV